MSQTFRRRVHTCANADTYKYFVSKERLESVWTQLQERYGTTTMDEVFRVKQIETERLRLRAGFSGNPITLVRKPGHTSADVDEFHAIVGWEDGSHGADSERAR